MFLEDHFKVGVHNTSTCILSLLASLASSRIVSSQIVLGKCSPTEGPESLLDYSLDGFHCLTISYRAQLIFAC